MLSFKLTYLTWLGLEIIILTEASQTEKNKLSCDIAYMWNLKKKMVEMKFFTDEKQTHRHRKQTYGYQRGKWGKR